MTDHLFSDADIISRYTRAEAIADGSLVDLVDVAEKTGYGPIPFKYPVACTRAVFEECIRVPEGSAQHKAGEDIKGRLHDVLMMLLFAIKSGRGFAGGDDRVEYDLDVTRDNVRPHATKRVTLLATCGPGDDAEPVITISYPGED